MIINRTSAEKNGLMFGEFNRIFKNSKRDSNDLFHLPAAISLPADPGKRKLFKRMWSAAAKKTNRIAMIPVELPDIWSKVLRISSVSKKTIEQLFEVNVIVVYLDRHFVSQEFYRNSQLYVCREKSRTFFMRYWEENLILTFFAS